ncbi:hypothetical protein ACFPMF_09085 [Larkinella bovis]|uniref:Uncharacterized protein n=1 Tax=Larkinella bovis TaxID=683041 RepID=A0ABW0I9A8_9BACT
MEKILLSRNFLKKPGHVIAIALFTVLVIEAISWVFHYEKKVIHLQEYGGILGYLYIVLGGAVLPEMATLIIILTLLNQYHMIFRIKYVKLNWSSILRYELLILPVLLIAFFFFNPITQTVRFLLLEFPHYDVARFMENYVMGTYSLRYYFLYLLPVFIMGYGAINASLVNDLMKAGRNYRSDTMAVE